MRERRLTRSTSDLVEEKTRKAMEAMQVIKELKESAKTLKSQEILVDTSNTITTSYCI